MVGTKVGRTTDMLKPTLTQPDTGAYGVDSTRLNDDKKADLRSSRVLRSRARWSTDHR